MPITLHLTNADARRIAKQLHGNPKTAAFADGIDSMLEEQSPSAPWRKVTDSRWSAMGYSFILTLECGHTKSYTGSDTTFKAASYKRVRCNECA